MLLWKYKSVAKYELQVYNDLVMNISHDIEVLNMQIEKNFTVDITTYG